MTDFPGRMASTLKYALFTSVHLPFSKLRQRAIVVVAHDPVHPLEAFKAGTVHTMLTHDLGCSWTDTAGEVYATAAVKDGGQAIFVFESLVDAQSCCRHLRAAGVSGGESS